jgi:hypothetical protein
MGSEELCLVTKRPKTPCWPCESNAKENAWNRNLNVKSMSDSVRGKEQPSVNKLRLYMITYKILYSNRVHSFRRVLVAPPSSTRVPV